jgi:hypothetical protein
LSDPSSGDDPIEKPLDIEIPGKLVDEAALEEMGYTEKMPREFG